MASIFLICSLIFAPQGINYAFNVQSEDVESESSEFWPADMVPHPHIPGTGPREPQDGWVTTSEKNG